MTIKTIDDLSKWASQVEKEIIDLKAANQDKWTSRYFGPDKAYGMTEKQQEQAGLFLKGVFSGNKNMVEDGGGHPVNDALMALETKGAPTGSPLYSDAASGSYLVPTELAARVYYVQESNSVIAPLCEHTLMSSRTKTVPVEDSQSQCYWITLQASGITETTPTFKTETLTAYGLACWTSFTQDEIDDDATGLVSYFTKRFGEKFSDKIENMIFQGNANPMTGILYDADVNVASMAAGLTTEDDIDYDSCVALVTALPESKYRRGARFFLNPLVMDKIRLLKDAHGRPIFVEPTATSPGSILGYSAMITDNMPSTATAGTAFMCYGNPGNGSLLIGDRRMLSVDLYDRTYYRAVSNQVFLTAFQRLGFIIPVPDAWSILKTASV